MTLVDALMNEALPHLIASVFIFIVISTACRYIARYVVGAYQCKMGDIEGVKAPDKGRYPKSSSDIEKQGGLDALTDSHTTDSCLRTTQMPGIQYSEAAKKGAGTLAALEMFKPSRSLRKISQRTGPPIAPSIQSTSSGGAGGIPAQGTKSYGHVNRPDYSQPVPTISSEPHDSVEPQFLEYLLAEGQPESHPAGSEDLETLYQTLYSMIPGFALNPTIHEVLLHHAAAYLETLLAENAAARVFLDGLENGRKVDTPKHQNDAPKRRRKRGIATASRKKCIKPKRLSKRQTAASSIVDSDDSEATEIDPSVSPVFGPPNHDPTDSDTTEINPPVYNPILMELDTSESDEGDSPDSWTTNAKKAVEMGIAKQARYGIRILTVDKHSTLRPSTFITSTGKVYNPTGNRHEDQSEGEIRRPDAVVQSVEELAAEWAATLRDYDMKRNNRSASPMKRKASSDSSNRSSDDDEEEDDYRSERSRSPNKMRRMRRSVTPELEERMQAESDGSDSL